MGACVSEFRDGRQVEGIWIGERWHSPDECDRPAFCERMVEVARERLLARVPSAPVREVRFYDMSHELSDNTIVALTHQTYRIVFTLTDGSERIEYFGCDIEGNLMGGLGAPAYAEFCPEPHDGPPGCNAHDEQLPTEDAQHRSRMSHESPLPVGASDTPTGTEGSRSVNDVCGDYI